MLTKYFTLKESRSEYVLTMLGEVDTGFVIWYRSQRQATQLSESLEKTVSTYSNFIKNIKAREKIVVSSASDNKRQSRLG